MVQSFTPSRIDEIGKSLRTIERFTTRRLLGFLLIPAIAGAANGFSIAWPFQIGLQSGQANWLLSLLSMAMLYRATVIARSNREAALATGAFGFAWFVTALWWLYIAMHIYGGLPSALAIAALAALALGLSTYYVVGVVIFRHITRRYIVASPFVFASIWTLAEIARGTWLTGFGWGGVGYAHTDGPFAGLAPWIGVYGVTAIAVLFAALISYAPMKRLKSLSLVLLLVVCANFTRFNVEWTRHSGQISVSLLQGNIAQDEKFETGIGVPMALSWYGRKLEEAKGQLVVAPETAIPLLPGQLPPNYLERLRGMDKWIGNAALFGIPLGNYAAGYTNSVIALGGNSPETWQYNKSHLVPFGEFIPPLFKWFTQMMNIPLGDFERGTLQQDPFLFQSQRVAVNICYEDLFGEELAVRFLNREASPTLFANVSNIAWFGDSTAMDQHLSISRMRAMEFERPFLRATNTGATAILDHKGNVVAALPRLTQGVLDGIVDGRDGLTPYTSWVSRLGLWPIWLLALTCCAWAYVRNKEMERGSAAE